jgi:hypothetical protein
VSDFGGYQFYFLSAENKALFDSDPTKYAPQWGGFCAWGVSGELCPEYPWDRDCLGPNADFSIWTIRDDKLFFFYKTDAKAWFMEDVKVYVKQGEERWAEWFGDGYHYSTECYVGSYLYDTLPDAP